MGAGSKNTIHQLYSVYLKNTGISIDTRSIKQGDLFFALKGANFDGNVYAELALQRGASYAVIDDPTYSTLPNTLLVDDVLQTLQELAAYHRTQLTIPVVAIAGSNGKTTTKELAHAVLSKQYNCLATKGNLNNHIGVPLTVLSITQYTEIALIEMGANAAKEHELLCAIAGPNFGLITNNGKDHLEGFGSEQGVIEANKEVYDYLKQQQGCVFFNALDAVLVEGSKGMHSIPYGGIASGIHAEQVSSNPFVKFQWNGYTIQTKLTGTYNIPNFLCAIAIGVYFKVPNQLIIEALEEYEPTNNRSQFTERKGYRFILDAYNANPSSMGLSIESLLQTNAPKKGLILGDMFELGAHAALEHQHILDLIANHSFAQVHLVGKEFYAHRNQYSFDFFESTEKYLAYLKTHPLLKEPLYLLKGSRGMRLERVLEVI